MPYLRIFDPEKGSCEVQLDKDRVVIGRSPKADVILRHASVSRIHAVVHAHEDGFQIEDANSTSGTDVNGEPVVVQQLAHGDTIQIATYVIEYRTDDGALTKLLRTLGKSRLEQIMRMSFRMPPGGLGVRYRTLSVQPDELFEAGDTLQVGGGGLLLPETNPPEEGTCLEIELTWPGGRRRRTFVGEILGHVKLGEGRRTGLCVKLHALTNEKYRQALLHSRRGSWVVIRPGA